MITTRQIIRACLGESYDYGFVGIDVPVEQANFILDWGNLHVTDEMLYMGEDDDEMGREDEIHITVKYGLVAEGVPKALYKIAADTEPFPVNLGKLSLFESDGYDVLKLEIKSPGLKALNQKISALPNEDRHPVYTPHSTIAYVQKGSADGLVGANIFNVKGAPDSFFTAYGMSYKGSTPPSGNDLERPKEEFLFSKTKSMRSAAMQAELARTESKSPFDGMPFPAEAKELIQFLRKRGTEHRKILS